MQAHKKELRNKKLKLPSSVFESYIEEPIGLLNKAAPITGNINLKSIVYLLFDLIDKKSLLSIYDAFEIGFRIILLL